MIHKIKRKAIKINKEKVIKAKNKKERRKTSKINKENQIKVKIRMIKESIQKEAIFKQKLMNNQSIISRI